MSEIKFLTEEQIKIKCPEVYGKPAGRVSERYVHIPTTQVIKDLATMGWGVVGADSRKTRNGNTTGHHTVTFRNPDVIIEKNGDTVFPQIVLQNAHNGLGAFRFMAGLFRLVCSNGLVIADEKFAEMKVRHINYSYEEVSKVITKFIEVLPLTVDSMNKMATKELSEKQMIQFTKEAVKTRFSEKQLKGMELDYKELIQPTRREDADRTLWHTFNIIQEKLLSGNFRYVNVETQQVRKARPVTDFKKDIKVNKELFELAVSYA